MTAAANKNMNNEAGSPSAAEKFAAIIQHLAESGNIESISITIHAWNSNELFNLAHALGIKEISITSQSGF